MLPEGYTVSLKFRMTGRRVLRGASQPSDHCPNRLMRCSAPLDVLAGTGSDRVLGGASFEWAGDSASIASRSLFETVWQALLLAQGFCFGGMVQGIVKYDDWARVWYLEDTKR